MNQRANGQRSSGESSAKMALGMAIGITLGTAIGLALDSIAIGVAIGAGVGISLGVAFSGQRQEPSKPMTIAGVVLVAVGIVVLAIFMTLVRPQWWCQYPGLNLIPGC
jgi:multidrug transporter EmrE-like cation transporter